MMTRCLRVVLLVLCLLPAFARAGGGPLEHARRRQPLQPRFARPRRLLRRRSTASPQTHLCSIKTDPRASIVSLADFERNIHAPILAHIANRQLAGQIHFLVLCMDIPSRVADDNGITAALFYGYKPKTPGRPQCNVASNSVNQYYGAETAYTSTAGWNQTNAPDPLSADGRRSGDRQAGRRPRRRLAGPPSPTGVFCLYGSGDSARNIRYRTYPVVARLFALFGLGDRLETNAGDQPRARRGPFSATSPDARSPAQQSGERRLRPGRHRRPSHLLRRHDPRPLHEPKHRVGLDAPRRHRLLRHRHRTLRLRGKVPGPDDRSSGTRAASPPAKPWPCPCAIPTRASGSATPSPPPSPRRRPSRSVAPPATPNSRAKSTLQMSVAAHERGAPPVFLDLYIDGRHHAPVARPFAPGRQRPDRPDRHQPLRLYRRPRRGPLRRRRRPRLGHQFQERRPDHRQRQGRPHRSLRPRAPRRGRPAAAVLRHRRTRLRRRPLHRRGRRHRPPRRRRRRRPRRRRAPPRARPAPTTSNIPSISPPSSPGPTRSPSSSATAPPCSASPRPTSPSASPRASSRRRNKPPPMNPSPENPA